MYIGAMKREFGSWFAFRAMLFLPAMYWYHGAGLLLGIIAYASGRSVAADRRPPDPDFVVLEPG